MKRFFISTIALGAVFFSLTPLQRASAENSQSLYGLTESQITDRFGKPDDVKEKPGGGAEWVYGQSTVFFLGKKVSAWSDNGELMRRVRLKSLQSDKASSDDGKSEQWVNPWTPPKRGGKGGELPEGLEE